MKSIQVILVDPIEKTIQGLEIPSGLEGLRSALGCRLIEVVEVGENIDIICDEEGLLSNDAKISLLNHPDFYSSFPIAGKYLFCTHNHEGDTESITFDQVKEFTVIFFDNPAIHQKIQEDILNAPIKITFN